MYENNDPLISCTLHFATATTSTSRSTAHANDTRILFANRDLSSETIANNRADRRRRDLLMVLVVRRYDGVNRGRREWCSSLEWYERA